MRSRSRFESSQARKAKRLCHLLVGYMVARRVVIRHRLGLLGRSGDTRERVSGRCLCERRYTRLEESGDLLERPSFRLMVGKEHLDEGGDTKDAEDDVRLPLDVPECNRDELDERVRKETTDAQRSDLRRQGRSS